MPTPNVATLTEVLTNMQTGTQGFGPNGIVVVTKNADGTVTCPIANVHDMQPAEAATKIKYAAFEASTLP